MKIYDKAKIYLWARTCITRTYYHFFLNVSFNMQLNRKMDKCVAYQVVKLYYNDNRYTGTR